MALVKTICTVLVCRRCERMSRKEEVAIVNLHRKDETWRCRWCGGVCDAQQLRPAPGKPRKSRAKCKTS